MLDAKNFQNLTYNEINKRKSLFSMRFSLKTSNSPRYENIQKFLIRAFYRLNDKGFMDPLSLLFKKLCFTEDVPTTLTFLSSKCCRREMATEHTCNQHQTVPDTHANAYTTLF